MNELRDVCFLPSHVLLVCSELIATMRGANLAACVLDVALNPPCRKSRSIVLFKLVDSDFNLCNFCLLPLILQACRYSIVQELTLALRILQAPFGSVDEDAHITFLFRMRIEFDMLVEGQQQCDHSNVGTFGWWVIRYEARGQILIGSIGPTGDVDSVGCRHRCRKKR